MEKFMVVCTFKQGTEMSDVYAVVAEEQAKAAELQTAGKIGAIHLATLSRGTVLSRRLRRLLKRQLQLFSRYQWQSGGTLMCFHFRLQESQEQINERIHSCRIGISHISNVNAVCICFAERPTRRGFDQFELAAK
jgi:hypothetical protein